MLIRVKRLVSGGESTLELAVKSDATVADVRAQLVALTGLPVERQRLIYGGKILAGTETLAEHKIATGHSIHLTARPASSVDGRAGGSPVLQPALAPTMGGGGGGGQRNFRIAALTLPSTAVASAPVALTNLIRSSTDRAMNLSTTLAAAAAAASAAAAAAAAARVPPVPAPSVGAAASAAPASAAPAPGAAPGLASAPAAPQYGFAGGSLEHVRQGLLTVHTLLLHHALISTNGPSPLRVCGTAATPSSTDDDGISSSTSSSTTSTRTSSSGAASASFTPAAAAAAAASGAAHHVPIQTNQLPGARPSRTRFVKGQWVDARDSVNQWLEATVMETRGAQIYVHYNGWPARWDEWVDSGSHRLAPFRTHTLHSSLSPHLSPSPVNPPEGSAATGSDDARAVMQDVHSMYARLMPLVERLDALYAARRRHTERAGDVDAADATDTVPAPWGGAEELRRLTTLAPALERFGRLYADMSPHLAKLGVDAEGGPGGTIAIGEGAAAPPMAQMQRDSYTAFVLF